MTCRPTVWLWHLRSEISYHTTPENVLEIWPYKDGQCIFTSLPARVTSPLRQLKRIEHDVIASKSACRGDDLYQCYERTWTKCLPWCHRYNIWNSVGNQSRPTSIDILLLLLSGFFYYIWAKRHIYGWLLFTRLAHSMWSGFSWTYTARFGADSFLISIAGKVTSTTEREKHVCWQILPTDGLSITDCYQPLYSKPQKPLPKWRSFRPSWQYTLWTNLWDWFPYVLLMSVNHKGSLCIGIHEQAFSPKCVTFFLRIYRLPCAVRLDCLFYIPFIHV